MSKILSLTVSVLSFLSAVSQTWAAPSRLFRDDLVNSTHPFAEYGLAGDKRADKVPLRILSLGASIMSGVGSSTGNGLRKPLRDALRLDGSEVDMVGSLHGGTMVDHEHEAVPGDVLTQVRARLPRSIGFKPNVVIINAGTNDAVYSVDLSGVGSRMNDILNDLWAGEDMGNSCMILSTLIPTTNTAGAANRPGINDQYRALVTQRASEGKCIYLADMDPGGAQWLQFDTDYLATESPHVHPNDSGHKKMAAVFYKAINEAIAANKIVKAADFAIGDPVCDKFAGTGIDAGGLTQRGSGHDDGIYYHDSEEMGILFSADSDWDRSQWKFGRLFDQNHDDLLAWISNSDTEQVYAVWANSADGKGSFSQQMSDLVPDLLCDATGVHFIDMTGDGLDDLVCINANGDAYLSVNQGDGNRAGGKSPTFKRASSSALIKSNEGYKRERVILADIDGDGRGDYGVIDDSGNIYFWRNGWIDPVPAYWQSLGLRFTGKNMGDVRGSRFGDINGDGRDDWLWVDDDGATYTYTNGRSCKKGVEGDGLNVAWRQGFYTGESSGPTHKGMAAYLTDTETYLRDRVHFARISGIANIFGNLPTLDYVFMQHTKLSTGKHRFQMRVWKNTGGGASKLLADGNRYCNMVGHSDGLMDYVWMYSYGTMELFINRGKGSISDSDPDGFWDFSSGVIWTPPSNLNRRDLHLADWDGDGACDIIYVNPEGGGVSQVWINGYPSTGKWTWTPMSNPAPSLQCSQKRGLGLFDMAVEFADITGNGRADYLCMEPDSRTTGFIHNSDGSWENAGQIKVSITKDRANMRWADVNGDGKADLLWIEKFSGDGYVWYNNGPADPAVTLGSSFSWRQQDSVAYAGNVAGSCEYFPDLDGNGRADEHFVLGTFNNEARTAYNPSCGLTDVTGDDASMVNDLPTVPGGDSSGGGGDDGGNDGGGDDGGDSGDGDLPDYPSRFGGGNPNCGTTQDFFAHTYYVGNDQGGDPFCMAKWKDGIFPKLIEARATDGSLAYLRVVFTDNTEMSVGTAVSDDGHHRYGTLEWQPFVDTFDKFSLWAGGWNGGVGRLVAGISGKEEIDAGKYWDDPPVEYPIPRGYDGKGMLLGFYGSAGDRIDSLEPIFSSYKPNRVSLTNATFNPSYEALNTLPFSERKMSVVSVFGTHSNDLDDETEVDIELRIRISKQTAITFSHEGGYENGGEVGGTVGGEVSWSVGVPELADVNWKGKAEITGKYVRKDIYKTIRSSTDTEVEQIETRMIMKPKVKPGKTVECIASAVQSSLTLKYDCTLELIFDDENSYKYDASGVFVNAMGSQIASHCGYVETDDADASDFDEVITTATYCLDGTFLGEGLVTDDNYFSSCPQDWQNL